MVLRDVATTIASRTAINEPTEANTRTQALLLFSNVCSIRRSCKKGLRPWRGLLSLKTILGSQRIQAEQFLCARILWPVSNVFKEQAGQLSARPGAANETHACSLLNETGTGGREPASDRSGLSRASRPENPRGALSRLAAHG